ncbi:MAG: pirin family protein [Chitinophagales bacterium]|nr:pirin family protein [Chitinophagales bacterium]MDW8393212.1 pirin family protein [Chitinophagales bacterium]
MSTPVTLYPESTRGRADYGWLQANYSFSFGAYYDQERLHFGALRVLNDDTVAPAAGFDWHPHRNMEIITIPLSGHLQHRDSMGHTAVIGPGEVQVMSAGTGVYHSEFNASAEHPVSLLQIWILPERQNVAPRYDQIRLPQPSADMITVVGPRDNGGLSWIHQQAWITLAHPAAGQTLTYPMKQSKNGLYLFVIEGTVYAAEQELNRRDALGCERMDALNIRAATNSRLLLIEVPLLTLTGS